MPLTTITIREGRTPEQKRALFDAVHAGLREAFGIPENDRQQIITEISPDNWDVGKGPDMVIIEIKAFAGRSVDAKRALYKAVVASLEKTGVRADDVFIMINDLPLENWGIRGGQAACDVDFGFKIDV